MGALFIGSSREQIRFRLAAVACLRGRASSEGGADAHTHTHKSAHAHTLRARRRLSLLTSSVRALIAAPRSSARLGEPTSAAFGLVVVVGVAVRLHCFPAALADVEVGADVVVVVAPRFSVGPQLGPNVALLFASHLQSNLLLLLLLLFCNSRSCSTTSSPTWPSSARLQLAARLASFCADSAIKCCPPAGLRARASILIVGKQMIRAPQIARHSHSSRPSLSLSLSLSLSALVVGLMCDRSIHTEQSASHSLACSLAFFASPSAIHEFRLKFAQSPSQVSELAGKQASKRASQADGRAGGQAGGELASKLAGRQAGRRLRPLTGLPLEVLAEPTMQIDFLLARPAGRTASRTTVWPGAHANRSARAHRPARRHSSARSNYANLAALTWRATRHLTSQKVGVLLVLGLANLAWL